MLEKGVMMITSTGEVEFEMSLEKIFINFFGPNKFEFLLRIYKQERKYCPVSFHYIFELLRFYFIKIHHIKIFHMNNFYDIFLSPLNFISLDLTIKYKIHA